MSAPQDAITAAIPVLDALQSLGVNHYVGGSLASSVHGLGRTTLDADLIADLKQEHVRPLVMMLEKAYYIEPTAVENAIRRKSSFNVIHFDTMIKVDVFVQKSDPFNLSVAKRVKMYLLDEDHQVGPYPISSAEDIILHKLLWYQEGQEVSDRQWSDLTNVMKVQGPSLDRDYLSHWAERLGVDDLLERAWEKVNELGA